jgi:hypothetical protein
MDWLYWAISIPSAQGVDLDRLLVNWFGNVGVVSYNYDRMRTKSFTTNSELGDLIVGAVLPMGDCHLCFKESSLLK